MVDEGGRVERKMPGEDLGCEEFNIGSRERP